MNTLNDMQDRALRPLPVHVGVVLNEPLSQGMEEQELTKGMIAMMDGVKKYQDHFFQRNMKPLPSVWTQGEASLLFCAADKNKKNGQALFLVPSMINGSEILDLLPERSFVRWLAAQGFDVYLLDWGQAAKDEALADMEGVVKNGIVPAIEFVKQNHGGAFDALGYCMGGTLLAAAATFCRDSLRRIVFLASPWDFHAGDRGLTTQIRLGTALALQMIEKDHSLPVNWVQSVFAVVNADRTMSKFSNFSGWDQGSDKARLFVSVEDWLNNGMDLPGQVARSCILDWYGENKPGKGEWHVAGQLIVPENLDIQSLVVASSSDRLVPPESSLALVEKLPKADSLSPAMGHIGMMTGHKARKEVWEPIVRWLS